MLAWHCVVAGLTTRLDSTTRQQTSGVLISKTKIKTRMTDFSFTATKTMIEKILKTQTIYKNKNQFQKNTI